MKEYLKRFWIWYAIVAVLAVVYAVLTISSNNAEGKYIRTNTECLTEERVFDYADKLTDKEEQKLRELIEIRENQIGCDIVLVTVNDPELNTDGKMMKYADYFCIDNKLGYNKAVGDAVIYVDNWYNGYVWMCTSGKAQAKYSSAMIDHVIDYACAVVNRDAYQGYERYVNQVYSDMSSRLGLGSLMLQPMTIFIIAIVVTGIYLFVNLSGRKGKKTTTASTYVARDAQPALHNAQDIFVTKHVTRRRIESSSGGGGGGGSHSTGGHSFGGGGGRH
ncbi:MAG: TPM domain-containing protein [Lachnospiraceae bacterium]|nr:TPM domain-containing protein [Lachnospiraceae bacterium]